MELNVAQLLKAPVGTSRQFDLDEQLPTIDEFPTIEPVRGHVKLTRTNRGIFVEASLHTAVRLQCSRCLEEVTAPVDVQIREEFLPTVDVNTGLPIELPAGSYAFTIDEHHILDLGEAVRQYALLNLPLQPLCRPDCAGLCPACGQNLNRGRCACSAEPEDTRMATLARLLREIEDKE